jgi:hypothetical protein
LKFQRRTKSNAEKGEKRKRQVKTRTLKCEGCGTRRDGIGPPQDIAQNGLVGCGSAACDCGNVDGIFGALDPEKDAPIADTAADSRITFEKLDFA